MSGTALTLTSGLELHQAGRLAEAEQVYRQVLAVAPQEAHAWYLLGTLQYQQGQVDQAIQHLQRAVAIGTGPRIYRKNLAAVYANSNRFEEAAAEYSRLIETDTGDAEAYASLGNMRLGQERYVEALPCYQRALALAPQHLTVPLKLAQCLEAVGQASQACELLETMLRHNAADVDALSRLLFLLAERGRSDDALEYCRRAVEFAPREARVHNCLGVAYALQRRRDEAIASYRAALQHDPTLGEAWNNLGAAYHENRAFAEAIDAHRQALRLNERNSGAHYNLADSLRAQGHADEAISHYRRAIQLAPNYAAAYNNLGAALQEQGLDEEASEQYAQAIRCNPRSAEAYNNLGNALRCLGRPCDALTYAEQALVLRPDFAEAHSNLALSLRDLTRFDDALAHFNRAIALKPEYAEAQANLGDFWREQSRIDQALAYYARSNALSPQDGLRVKAALALPIIPQSVAEVDHQRARLARELAELEASELKIDKPVVDIGMTAFYLAYHGRDDLELQRTIARVCVKATPSLEFSPPPQIRPPSSCAAGTRRRVGLVSSLLREHTIGHLNLGLIQQLSRERFEVVLFVYSPPNDRFAERIYAAADRVVQLSSHLGRARERILAERPDLLFYLDIGMEPVTYFLAFSRLAPVQCVTWGHPVTTGIPTIDYFISDVDLEPPGAERHYSERLVRLNHLPTYYSRPQLTEDRRTRAEFGLAESAHLYFCAQSLFKLQPDFDALLAGILAADGHAEIVLLDSSTSGWNEQIRSRLAGSIGTDFARIRFLPRMSPDDFFKLSSRMDVILDTPHFSGGRTSLDAFALGTPVVTLPGRFMRGRVTYACYRKMELMDCVAQTPQDYVDIAVRLGTDHAWRDSMRREILARNHVLFENPGFLHELETFFERAIQEATTR